MVYLTTHDIIWINTTVTGCVNRFDYVTLEGAMAAQYRYGDSSNVAAQAAGFLEHQLSHIAFERGVRRTALIAVLTFLNANAYATIANDAAAAALVRQVAMRETTAERAIAELAAPAAQKLPEGISLRTLITDECSLHAEALNQLEDGD